MLIYRYIDKISQRILSEIGQWIQGVNIRRILGAKEFNFTITISVTMFTFDSLIDQMRIIAIKTLKEFWDKYPDARANLQKWRQKMETSSYTNPQEITNDFNDSDFVGNTRIVFNIARNKYRMGVAFRYDKQICWIKFIGTHVQYDKIDVTTVEHK